MSTTAVSVTIVTWNSRRWIGACLESLFAQEDVALEVIVVDNGSTDGTQVELAPYRDRLIFIQNHENVGFAAGQNLAISKATREWVLTLNPDVLLAPGCIRGMLEAGESDRFAGSVCGKLLRIRPDFTRFEVPRIDSAGMYFTPPMRHFDRGWNEPDSGQYDRVEYVFGPSAAVALYRRAMIADVSLDGHFFDPDFFSYREDADVAWRAQLLGWRCLYTPHAVGWHVRRVTPANRRQVPAVLNMHSVKNRFLMRIKNMTGPLYRRNWWATTARDVVVICGCLVYEHRSLRAFPEVIRGLRRAIAWRRHVLSRRKATDRYMASWFADEPVSLPFPSLPDFLESAETAGAAGVPSLTRRVSARG